MKSETIFAAWNKTHGSARGKDGFFVKVTYSIGSSKCEIVKGNSEMIGSLRAAVMIGIATFILSACGETQVPPNTLNHLLETSGRANYGSLYSFKAGTDGQEPKAGLIDVSGLLYGTTYAGGSHGDGTVFRISTAGAEDVLYSFQGGKDGANPSASLVAVKGFLYGTTEYGGLTADPSNGTVFRIQD
jgi:uncharacterized repeat protein (TIGR03803 family)